MDVLKIITLLVQSHSKNVSQILVLLQRIKLAGGSWFENQ